MHPANIVFLVETRFHQIGQAGLKLLTSGDPPTSASQSAGITGVIQIFFNFKIYLIFVSFSFFKDKVLLYCSDWTRTPGLRQSSWLNLLSSWEYRCMPLYLIYCIVLFYFIYLFIYLFWDRVSLCRPGWSAIARSQVTATSASWVKAILLP